LVRQAAVLSVLSEQLQAQLVRGDPAPASMITVRVLVAVLPQMSATRFPSIGTYEKPGC